MHQRITEEIPADVLLQANQKLNELKTLLAPYMYALTLTERHDLPKMSNKSYSFVHKIAEYCSSNPEFKPSYIDEHSLNLDFNTVVALRPVFEQCQQLFTQLDDTMMLAGSEAYSTALVYYNAVKMAAKNGTANAKPILEDLSARFPGRSRSKPTDTAQ